MFGAKRQIFRKVALERLASPEQLDVVMRVTRPWTWIALAGSVVLLAAISVWGFVGSIPTKVQAQGILIKPGGVFDVFTTGSGPIVAIAVAEGTLVQRGQLIATIAQPELEAQIANLRAQLRELQAQHRELTEYASKDLALREDSLVLQESKLHDTIAYGEQRVKALRDQIEAYEPLLERGLITKQTVLQAQQDLFGTTDAIEQARAQLKQIPVDKLATATTKEREIVRSQLSINETERRVELLEQQLDLTSHVYSPYDGRVIEVKKNQADFVGPGTPLVSLQLSDEQAEGLQALIYVPAGAGKHVTPGMPAQISPTTAPREEFGFLLGRITYVSEFPSTAGGMMRVLANEGLVQSLSAAGPPFAVYAELVPDSASVSGYRWSSPKGGPLKINAGMIIQVTVTVRERRPVEFVVPILREYTGL